jgi:hypothetical protein
MPSWKKVILSGSDAALNSLNVTTAFTASGLNYPTTDNGEESFLQTNGSGDLSFQYVKTIYEEIYNGEATTITKGTPVYVSGSVGAAGRVFRADAGNPTKMPVIYISADNIASAQVGRGIALGLITGVNTTGYPAGTEIYVAVGGGWTSTRPTGSAIVQSLGYVTREGNGGQGVVLNPGPNSLPNLTSGSVWVGNSSSIPTAVTTSSLSVASASFASTASFVPGGVTGTGTTNFLPKFTGATSLGDSQIFDNGTQVKVGNFNLGVASTTLNLAITGSTRFSAERNAFIEISTIPGNFPQINGYGNGVNITTSNSYSTNNGSIRVQPQSNSNIDNRVLGTGVQTWSTGGSERMRITSTGNLLLNTTADAGFRLDVNGTARVQGASNVGTTTAFTITNSDSINLLQVQDNGYIRIGSQGTSAFRIYSTDTSGDSEPSGLNLVLNSRVVAQAQVGNIGMVTINGPAGTATSGNQNVFLINKPFSPTSGTGTYAASLITSTINQTGGANGITRGLFINPTLTAAADFRAIEVSNNTGFGIFQSGTATNSFAGNVLINTTTDAGFRLDVNGTARVQGNSFEVTNGATNRIAITSNQISCLSGVSVTNMNIVAGAISMPNSNLGIGTTVSGGTTSTLVIGSGNATNSSGIVTIGQSSRGFAPTSGTATFSFLTWDGTINQTGGANGITRGLFINPTLTSAANWRSIELTNNTGFGIFQSGTAVNSFAGNVGIGTITPGAKLDVQGTLIVSSSILQYSNNASITSGSTANVASFSTGSYTAGFFDYVATSGTNARAGTVFTVWNANNVEFTETSTNDIGSTSNLILSASLSAGAIRLQATSLTGTWSVKTLARMI